VDYSNNANDSQLQFLFQEASVGRRLGAFLIDHIIFTFVFMFAYSFVFFAIHDDEPLWQIARIVFWVIFFLVYGLRDIIKGQSIGKRVFGIGVRDVSDNFTVPSVPRLFLRQIFSPLWPIEFLALVFSSENRKIGDKIAGTGVYNLREYEDFVLYAKRMGYINQIQGDQGTVPQNVRVVEPYQPKKTKIAVIIIGAVLVFVILFCAMFFGVFSVLRNHTSYHLATEYIRANPEIVAVIGEVEGFGFRQSGSLSISSGRGDASYSIDVRGTDGNARVFIELQMRDGGDWEVVRFNFVQR